MAWGKNKDEDDKDGAEIIPFPLPKKPLPANPDPPCLCASQRDACPKHNS
jgi:hypothetical protein